MQTLRNEQIDVDFSIPVTASRRSTTAIREQSEAIRLASIAQREQSREFKRLAREILAQSKSR